MNKLDDYCLQYNNQTLPVFDREIALANALTVVAYNQIVNEANNLPPVEADRDQTLQWLKDRGFSDRYMASVVTDEHISISAYDVAEKLIWNTAPRYPRLAMVAALDDRDWLTFYQAVAIWHLYGRSLRRITKEVIA